MDKENDIFEQPSKVQNMNYLFEEEEITAPEPKPAQSSAPSDGAERRRPASSQRPRPQQGNGQQRRPRPSNGTPSQRPRPSQERAPRRGTEDPASNAPETDSSFRQPQARTANRVTDANRAQTRRPSQAQPRRVRPEDARQPRQARPSQAQPAQTRSNASRNSSSRSQNGASGRSRDSYDSRRVNRPASSSKGGGTRNPKKKSSGFKKFLLIYSAILLVILIVGMIIFGSFLKSLESNQPSNIAADIALSLSADKAQAYLEEHEDMINCFGEPKDLIAQFASEIAGKEPLSFIENKDYRADAPSYNITTSDGTTVAKVTLEKAGSGSFGLSTWKVAAIDIADFMDTNTFNFLAPHGSTITINDTPLDDKYQVGEEGIPEQLKTASKYVTIPNYITYKIAGIAGDPKISAKDANGKELALTSTDDTLVAGSETTQEFIDSVSPIVEGTLNAWGRHFINMGGNLSAYMLEGSDWYTYIFGGPDMDPIMTAFYEYESIANYEFTEKSIQDYIRYTDDCFTVDVHYKMKIDFTTDQMSDDNQQLNATWVFITQNNGQDWYLVDCIYK